MNLLQHGVSQTRPFGPEMASIYHRLSKTEVVESSGPKGCARSNGLILENQCFDQTLFKVNNAFIILQNN